MSIKVIIIDDEPLARQLVKNFLSEYSDLEVLAECGDGFEALKAIQQLNPDLVFLDIQMPKLDGFELLDVLPSRPEIVFTTAYDQFAIKAFELNAVDYLLKPFSRERFGEALQKARSRVGKNLAESALAVSKLQNHIETSREAIERVVTRLGSKITVIPVDKIHYLEAQDDYVMIYSELGNHLKEKTMRYFEQHLPSNTFVRIHRSSIINISQISAVELYTKDTHLVSLKCGAKLKASEEGYKRLRSYL
ncbi:MAG: response regulator [Bacteroidales bacterium]|nr:response regulator [Bacteroidales bacterium]